MQYRHIMRFSKELNFYSINGLIIMHNNNNIQLLIIINTLKHVFFRFCKKIALFYFL